MTADMIRKGTLGMVLSSFKDKPQSSANESEQKVEEKGPSSDGKGITSDFTSSTYSVGLAS